MIKRILGLFGSSKAHSAHSRKAQHAGLRRLRKRGRAGVVVAPSPEVGFPAELRSPRNGVE